MDKSLFSHVYNNNYLRDRIKECGQSDLDRVSIARICSYNHWYTADQMLDHGHIGLLIDKLKRNEFVPFSKRSIETICEKVLDTQQFKYLYQLKQSSFLASNLVSLACKGGNADIVKILLQQVHPITLSVENAYSAAFDNGRQKVIETLLDMNIKYLTTWSFNHRQSGFSLDIINIVNWFRNLHHPFKTIQFGSDRGRIVTGDEENNGMQLNLFIDNVLKAEKRLARFKERHPSRCNDTDYLNRYLGIDQIDHDKLVKVELQDQNNDENGVQVVLDFLFAELGMLNHLVFSYISLRDLPILLNCYEGHKIMAMKNVIQRTDAEAFQILFKLYQYQHGYNIPSLNLSMTSRISIGTKASHDWLMNNIMKDNPKSIYYSLAECAKPPSDMELAFLREDYNAVKSYVEDPSFRDYDARFLMKYWNHRFIIQFYKILKETTASSMMPEYKKENAIGYYRKAIKDNNPNDTLVNGSIPASLISFMCQTQSKQLYKLYVTNLSDSIAVQKVAISMGAIDILKYIDSRKYQYRLKPLVAIESGSIKVLEYIMENQSREDPDCSITKLLPMIISSGVVEMLDYFLTKNGDPLQQCFMKIDQDHFIQAIQSGLEIEMLLYLFKSKYPLKLDSLDTIKEYNYTYKVTDSTYQRVVQMMKNGEIGKEK